MKTKLLKKLRHKFLSRYTAKVKTATYTYALYWKRYNVYESTSLNEVEQHLKREIRDDICFYVHNKSKNLKKMEAIATEFNKKYFW